MKKHKPFFFLFLFISLCHLLEAQDITWSITGNFGLSKTKEKLKGYIMRDRVFRDFSRYNHHARNTYNYGGEITFKLTLNSSLKTGLSYYLLTESRHSELDLRFEPGPIPIPPASPLKQIIKNKYKVSYCGVPIVYKYQIDKMSFDLGFLFLFFIKGDIHYRSDFIGESTFYNKPFESKVEVKYSTIDIGLNLGLSYDITNNLSIRAKTFFSLKDLIPYEISKNIFERRQLYNQFITIGVAYHLPFNDK